MATSYDLESVPTSLPLGVGDRLTVWETRRSILSGWGVDPNIAAEDLAERVEREMRARGVLVSTTLGRREWLDAFDFYIEVDATVDGFTDPEQRPILAASALQWALIVLAAGVLHGWQLSSGASISSVWRDVLTNPDANDTVKLFPVAIAIVAIVYLLSKA